MLLCREMPMAAVADALGEQRYTAVARGNARLLRIARADQRRDTVATIFQSLTDNDAQRSRGARDGNRPKSHRAF